MTLTCDGPQGRLVLLPFWPQHSGPRPSKVVTAPGKQEQHLPLQLPSPPPLPPASNCQACRAQVLPWKPGTAPSWG